MVWTGFSMRAVTNASTTLASFNRHIFSWVLKEISLHETQGGAKDH